MARYALILNGRIDTISNHPNPGWIEVPSDAFPGDIDNGDGTYSRPPAAAEPGSLQRVVTERNRRLALGFDFDFATIIPADPRGVHTFATTESDMKGWDEVTNGANAAMNLAAPTAPISIVTETGPVVVTAQEWQHILVAATAFRQPIWAASFVLQAMDPIPSDLEDDSYWP